MFIKERKKMIKDRLNEAENGYVRSILSSDSDFSFGILYCGSAGGIKSKDPPHFGVEHEAFS
jgi:hypothetical protein